MLIHHYSSSTGEYLSSGQPDADPRNDGRWLIPANATLDAPPERTPTSWPFYRDGAWFLLPDYRGRICYRTDTGEPVEISVAGKTPDELGLTTEPRPSPRHAWVDGAWVVPASVIAAEQQAAAQQTFDMLMAKARKANEGKADAYAAGQLDDEGIYYFKAWAAYQMALVSAFEGASSPDAIVWPSQPAPYVPPKAEPLPPNTSTSPSPTNSADTNATAGTTTDSNASTKQPAASDQAPSPTQDPAGQSTADPAPAAQAAPTQESTSETASAPAPTSTAQP
ncbi:tail fiber assembly protein [Burkholderia gladioli]|uniref:Tail assembly chaperone n=1 Tax=Burkholderia gladioli TaxID=28095 RepID=A0A2A7S8W1_BURGA|nr:tail fiber assembly protein [Burkholderia gladioli]MBU9427030.1 tail fiber assembly protein [Burkholderia gladioli]PEH40011.1 tail assembly chaperone [Burkholderia gladioli]PEH85206.1 tail assembly chaperone [Burkholderia gladioli]QPQ82823.1 tail fiber assembly protein [Burkholderia gladioli]